MSRCLNCFREYDDSFNICPYCGYIDGDSPKEKNQLYPSSVLVNGRYVIGQCLGAGGFGITYKAWDRKHDCIVAIKEYFPSVWVNRIPGDCKVQIYAGKRLAEYEMGRKRFLDEARNIAKFSGNKNIVHVFEFFEENNTAYIVMEFLGDKTIKTALEEDGTFSCEQAVNITLSICDALKAIHSQKILHRDIAPDNIFLCKNNVKVIDFGAARFSEKEDEKLDKVLKPGYAPVEQYDSISKQGNWTDIYALGAVLYQMITGIIPPESTNRKIEDTIKQPKELVPEISDNLNNTIMKALSVEAHMRFQNVDEMISALKGEINVATLEDEKNRRKKKRLISITAAAVAVCILFSTFGIFALKRADEERLEEASITVWYPYSTYNEKEKKEAMENYRKIFYSFNNYGKSDEKYGDIIKIDFVAIPDNEYEKALTQGSYGSSKKPNIFECTGVSKSVIESIQRVDLTPVINNVKKNCSVISIYNGDNSIIPLGFNVPIVYENSKKLSVSCTDEEREKYKDMFLKSDSEAVEILNKSGACYENLQTFWKNSSLVLGNSEIFSCNTKMIKSKDGSFKMTNACIGNESPAFWLTDTSYYNRLKNIGYESKYYSVKSDKEDAVTFTFEWCIRADTSDESQTKASKKFLQDIADDEGSKKISRLDFLVMNDSTLSQDKVIADILKGYGIKVGG